VHCFYFYEFPLLPTLTLLQILLHCCLLPFSPLLSSLSFSKAVTLLLFTLPPSTPTVTSSYSGSEAANLGSLALSQAKKKKIMFFPY
jgi:hypothetical protein